MSSRSCVKCDTERPITEYYRHPSGVDGRRPTCKHCENQERRERKQIATMEAMLEAESILVDPQDREIGWMEHVPCLGVSPSVFEDTSDPYEALSYCARCPFTERCLQRVRPARSHFDGIAGGRVYRDGRRVKRV